ncbi:MAG: hypothetical protein N3H31_05230 [Candidatus Nezhaarchaeota archaeon]|nr:hypothetical protein [Candidatus Nezhaarchaeota archaeon]
MPNQLDPSSLRIVVKEAVGLYNQTRSPEAEARLVEVRDDGRFVVEFSGRFCLTCGVWDWVEDLAYVLLSMGYEAKLVEVLEPADDEFKRIGVFKFKGEARRA